MLRSGNVVNATEHCKHGLVYFPENISGYAVLARAYLILNQEDRALNVLEAGYRRTGAEGLRSLHLFLQEDEHQVLESPLETPLVQEEPTVTTTKLEPDQDAEQSEDSALIESIVDDAEELAQKERHAAEPPVEQDDQDTETTAVAEFDVEATTSQDPERETTDDTGINIEGTSTDILATAELKDSPETEPEFFADTVLEQPATEEAQTKEQTTVPPPARGQEPLEQHPNSKKQREDEKQQERGGLSLHSVAKVSRLRSKNLRLIPGLEFAPLRRDENEKLKIAPLINELPPNFDEFVEKTVEDPPEIPVPESLEEIEEPVPVQEEPELSAEVEPQGKEETSEHSSEVDSLANITERIATATEEKTFNLPLEQAEPAQQPLQMTPLEELARRLETARIPIVAESEDEHENPAFEPSIVSDTFAGILVRQGAYAEAIKAYQMLSRMKPESRDHYQQKIEEMRWKMSSVVDESGGNDEA